MNTIMNKRIFLVDDDPYWTALLMQLLNDLGYKNINCFPGGKECVGNLHLNPEIVFLDYQMEDMDGLEVLNRIKDHYPGINVIFCTAYEDLSIAVNAIANGSYDYLLKGNATKKEVNQIMESISNESIISTSNIV